MKYRTKNFQYSKTPENKKTRKELGRPAATTDATKGRYGKPDCC